MLVLVQYGEIGIKGKNRRIFENMLLKNIRRALGDKLRNAELRESRIFLEVDGGEKEIRNALLKVFGLSGSHLHTSAGRLRMRYGKWCKRRNLRGRK